MILSDSAIKAAMDKGLIKIEPFDPKLLNPNSYDVRLATIMKTAAIHCEESLDARGDNSGCFRDIEITPMGKILHPGRFYLATTVEYTESHAHVPQLVGKSTNARNGIKVEMAGLGDVGFCGHWTLEIVVFNKIVVYPNMPIAQLVWHEVSGEVERPYAGRYQGQTSAQPAITI